MSKRKVINGVEIQEGGIGSDVLDYSTNETVVATAAGPQEFVVTNAIFQVPTDLSNKFSGISHTATGQDAGAASPVNTKALEAAGLGAPVSTQSILGSIRIVEGTQKYNLKTGKALEVALPPEVLNMSQVQADGIKRASRASTQILMGDYTTSPKKGA